MSLVDTNPGGGWLRVDGHEGRDCQLAPTLAIDTVE